MKRLLKWVLPALVLVEVALIWSGLLDFGKAVIIIVGVEALIFIAGISEIILMVKRYRDDRSSGLDPWAALEGGLSVLLPHPVARLAAAEPRMFYCLAKWALRKTKLKAGEFSYHKRSTMDMLVLLVVLVTPIEVLVIELLLQAFLPWLWLRLLVLLLEVYALLWILGFYASRIALPHCLQEKGIRLRYSVFVEGFVPYSVIDNVEHKHRKSAGYGDGLAVDGTEAFLSIGGYTDITIGLNASRPLNRLRSTKSVGMIHLAVDDPKSFLRALEERMASNTRSEKQPL